MKQDRYLVVDSIFVVTEKATVIARKQVEIHDIRHRQE